MGLLDVNERLIAEPIAKALNELARATVIAALIKAEVALNSDLAKQALKAIEK